MMVEQQVNTYVLWGTSDFRKYSIKTCIIRLEENKKCFKKVVNQLVLESVSNRVQKEKFLRY